MVKWKFPDNSIRVVNVILIIQFAAVPLLQGVSVCPTPLPTSMSPASLRPSVFESFKTVYTQVPDRQWRQLDDLQRAWRNVHEEALTKSFCIEDAKTGLLEMVT